MPLMAHKEFGFHQANSAEIEVLKGRGWELCDDPIAYKRRVWGIDVQPEKEPEDLPVIPPSPHIESPRRGRPRKAQ